MTSLEALLHVKQSRIDATHRFEPGRTALLVFDMQRGFLTPGAALDVPAGRKTVAQHGGAPNMPTCAEPRDGMPHNRVTACHTIA